MQAPSASEGIPRREPRRGSPSMDAADASASGIPRLPPGGLYAERKRRDGSHPHHAPRAPANATNCSAISDRAAAMIGIGCRTS